MNYLEIAATRFEESCEKTDIRSVEKALMDLFVHKIAGIPSKHIGRIMAYEIPRYCYEKYKDDDFAELLWEAVCNVLISWSNSWEKAAVYHAIECFQEIRNTKYTTIAEQIIDEWILTKQTRNDQDLEVMLINQLKYYSVEERLTKKLYDMLLKSYSLEMIDYFLDLFIAINDEVGIDLCFERLVLQFLSFFW